MSENPPPNRLTWARDVRALSYQSFRNAATFTLDTEKIQQVLLTNVCMTVGLRRTEDGVEVDFCHRKNQSQDSQNIAIHGHKQDVGAVSVAARVRDVDPTVDHMLPQARARTAEG